MIFIFKNTHSVMKSGKLCYNNGIPAKIIPTPRGISSDCSVSIELQDNSFKNTLEAILHENNITYYIDG